MKNDKEMRDLLINLLDGKGAHMTFDMAVIKFPVSKINEKFTNSDYTPWRLLEHIRRTQLDILDFIVNPKYKYLEWPNDYWPPVDAKATKKDFDETIAAYNKDLNKFKKLVKDPKTDLFKKIPWGEGQNIFKEVLVVADHTSYHLGEFAVTRQAMDTWPKGRDSKL